MGGGISTSPELSVAEFNPAATSGNDFLKVMAPKGQAVSIIPTKYHLEAIDLGSLMASKKLNMAQIGGLFGSGFMTLTVKSMYGREIHCPTNILI